MTICRLLTLAFTLCLTTGLFAQAPPTGSRIPNAEVNQPEYVLQLQQPGELATIRRLILEGNAEEARDFAVAYVAKVERPGQEAATRYAAYNALCVAYTHTGETDKAERECTRAIDLLPSRWQAYNSRGTLRMMAGDYAEAKDDYYNARKAAGTNNEDATSVILHNLEILRQRTTTASGSPEIVEID